MTDRIELSACTSMMVGKNASIDGSTMISRNEDRFYAIHPKRFFVQPAVHNRHETYVSKYNGLTMPLPEEGYRYTSTPNGDLSDGLNEEDGINEKNVALSATESVYANERVLAYDPLIKNGLAEDSMCSLVLPYINSAREGVKLMGDIVTKYGSAEGNGVQYSDENEVWYQEIVTGHHWVAVKIPDDCYAVAANQVAIENIDFNDPDNYMWSEGIQEFVSENHLNPSETEWNFRKIVGTDTEKDRHYNTPRVWYAQRYLNPEIKQEPESSDLPFIRKANRKLSVEDVQYVLKSHYNETEYDPLGNGTEEQKTTYRAISLSRTQNSHICQIRNNVPDAVKGVQWLGFGVPTFCPHVPFFTNANDTDETYRELPEKMTLKNAYWLHEALAMIVESHYGAFKQADIDYQKALSEWARTMIAATDKAIENQTDAVAFLTAQNHEIATHYNEATTDLLAQLVTEGTQLSKLTFVMDKNL